MARLSLGQKADRITRFILALRHPVICDVMKQHGFTREDLREGNELVSRVAEARLAQPGSTLPADPEIVIAVDAWENKWFPIIDATLTRHFPAIREAVFLNLAQTSGPEVVHTVRVLTDRIDALPKTKAEGGHGREGKQARDLLIKRGATPQVIAGVQSTLAMIAQPMTSAETPVVPLDDDGALEQAMWAWYLEWSAIARAAIKDRRLLRTLGFLQVDRSKGAADPGDDDTDVEGDEPSEPVAG